jgi:hypothetical protein
MLESLDREDESIVIFETSVNYLPVSRVSHLRRPESSATLPRETNVSEQSLVCGKSVAFCHLKVTDYWKQSETASQECMPDYMILYMFLELTFYLLFK